MQLFLFFPPCWLAQVLFHLKYVNDTSDEGSLGCWPWFPTEDRLKQHVGHLLVSALELVWQIMLNSFF